MYRWRLPDPVILTSRIRVTLQQIGAWDHGLFERNDDLATVAYWYQAESTDANVRQPLPDRELRRPR